MLVERPLVAQAGPVELEKRGEICAGGQGCQVDDTPQDRRSRLES